MKTVQYFSVGPFRWNLGNFSHIEVLGNAKLWQNIIFLNQFISSCHSLLIVLSAWIVTGLQGCQMRTY